MEYDAVVAGDAPVLVPLHQAWDKVDAELGIREYVAAHSGYRLSPVFDTLFHADFKEVAGCVLLADNYGKESFDEWREQFGGETAAIEAFVNHVHVSSLFAHVPSSPCGNQSVCEYVAQAVLMSWKQALQLEFPDRHFSFSYTAAGSDGDPLLTFSQDLAVPQEFHAIAHEHVANEGETNAA